MPITHEDKEPIVRQFQRNETDTGSPEVVIALLTQRIQYLMEQIEM
ncbi:TPA: 30S ribosomal protein S15, partial [Candidatus Micrarchaeota archaeon]|nr:30S ribosomal protein S15 [Candidatus Micrarchaeota archaeon]